MAQTLHMMNAPEINAKIASHQGRVANLLAQDTDVASFVEELCLTALGRPATEKELRIADRLFNATDKKQAGEDFLWTLLNSYDFLFIH